MKKHKQEKRSAQGGKRSAPNTAKQARSTAVCTQQEPAVTPAPRTARRREENMGFFRRKLLWVRRRWRRIVRDYWENLD